MDSWILATIGGWTGNFIKSFYIKISNSVKKSKNNKIDYIKKQNKRSDFFMHSQITDKKQPESIVFLENESNKNTLPILFSGFNDRYNLFEPISNYNINSLKRQKSKDNGDKEYVSNYHSFHSDFIVDFSFKSEDNVYKNKQDFLNLLLGEKRITYVIGSIGCGKSTFISHLIYFAKQEISNQNIAVISVSAKTLGGENIDREKEVYKIIEKSFHSDFKKVNIESKEAFNKVVNKHFRNHKLTIIIDDLDEIYDQSRALILKTTEHSDVFDEHFKDKAYIHVAVKVFSVIKSLLDDNDNVNFIIGLRDETFEAINTKYKKDTGEKSLKKLRNPLYINIKHLVIQDVLDKRFELGNLSSDNTEHCKYFYEFANEFANEFDGLHINGTRHVMAKIRELGKLHTSELFYPKWMLQLYIYLDGIQKYSQQACGILNIFLVNIDYRNAMDKYNKQWPKFSKEDHCQTFWLKYFICEYFYSSVNDEMLDADMVYEKFKKYERGIFNFSLYSITDTKHGRLISCSFDENEIGNQDYKLEKTNRLGYCFDKKIFFSFVYLSVIVNDAYLEIPKIKHTKSKKILKEIFDTKYSYDMNFFRKTSEWEKWLFEHIKKVLVFITILENSFLFYEKNKITDLHLSSPNFQKINENLKVEIKNISETIGISEEEINSKVNETVRISKSLGKHFKKHFKEYSKFIVEKSKLQ